MVHSTWVAPFFTPASDSAVAMPRSLWQCTDTVGLLDAVHMVHEVLDARAELLGQRVARGVGDVHHRGAGLDDGFDDAHEEVVVGAARVLGVELYVLDEVAGVLHALDRTLDALVLGNAQLVAQVARAHADAGMDARTLGVLERVGRRVDVLLHRAREAADDRLVAASSAMRRTLSKSPGLEMGKPASMTSTFRRRS